MGTAIKENKQQTGNFALVKLKKATYELLIKLSKEEGKTMAGFLDQLLGFLSSGDQATTLTPETPQQQVMNEMRGFRRDLSGIGRDLDGVLEYIRGLERPRMTMFDQYLITEAMKADPDVKKVGWYYKDEDGGWVFDNEGFQDWADEDREAKDREYERIKAEKAKVGK